ncbi:MAG: hypothetical protein E7054_07610 [Lentisphaerae bacterium]|nr:hypothetical protein [Lentisphaerota bacterium]
MELLTPLLILATTGILLYFGTAFYRPEWLDVIEFAIVTAFFPLCIHCLIFVPALAAAVVLTIVNIFVYRKSPGTRNLLRAISIPAVLVPLAILALFVAAVASC